MPVAVGQYFKQFGMRLENMLNLYSFGFVGVSIIFLKYITWAKIILNSENSQRKVNKVRKQIKITMSCFANAFSHSLSLYFLSQQVDLMTRAHFFCTCIYLAKHSFLFGSDRQVSATSSLPTYSAAVEPDRLPDSTNVLLRRTLCDCIGNMVLAYRTALLDSSRVLIICEAATEKDTCIFTSRLSVDFHRRIVANVSHGY